MLWFAWPAANMEPRHLPVAVVGPDPAASQLEQRLAMVGDSAFDLRTAPDPAAADQDLRDRKIYAAFVLDSSGLSLHLASAASPAVATMLTQTAQVLGAAQGVQVTVVDVVPAPGGDPRGGGFASGFLPLLMTGIAAGVVVALLAGPVRTRVLGLVGFAVASGILTTAMMRANDLFAGPYLTEAGCVALVTLAVGATVCGLGGVLGRPGIAAGAVLMFFVGNPISALTAAPELLPSPWGALGQLLPPGAGGTLLKSVAFFDGAGAARPLLTLLVWAVAGLLMTVVSGVRSRPQPSEPGRQVGPQFPALPAA